MGKIRDDKQYGAEFSVGMIMASSEMLIAMSCECCGADQSTAVYLPLRRYGETIGYFTTCPECGRVWRIDLLEGVEGVKLPKECKCGVSIAWIYEKLLERYQNKGGK